MAHGLFVELYEKSAVREINDAQSILRRLIEVCEEAKAQSPALFDAHELNTEGKYFVVVSGRSDRHVQGIARKVEQEMGAIGYQLQGVEGFEKGHWVLMDFGEVVLHIFYDPVRAHYDLEGMWAEASLIDPETFEALPTAEQEEQSAVEAAYSLGGLKLVGRH